MPTPRPRTTFGDQRVDAALTDVLATVGSDTNDDLVRSLLVTALDMDNAEVDRLELKIASQALAEMLSSWRVFSPHSDRAKVTIFGSARTKPSSPDYELAVRFGQLMADRDWMAITGAGPGIMTAGIEGVGLDRSFGVNIMLPFEQQAADIIDGDHKLATFKYFFTRKLTFMKETDAFALFPGGFGTLDEAFELLTLIQTGKSYPAPIVLLDHPDSTYWASWRRFVTDELLDAGMIGPADLDLFLHTHDAEEAAEYLCAFYSCYHSLRYVGRRLVLRLRSAISPEALVELNERFADIVVSGEIEAIDATDAERRDDDHVDLPRLALRFDNRSFARLSQLIHRINELGGREGVPAAAGLLHDVAPDPEA
ncbi:MAG: LOG family protein [Acidimicrobiia bacterium]|nr:LOG family protein [Acidimicrobiia bacterium]